MLDQSVDQPVTPRQQNRNQVESHGMQESGPGHRQNVQPGKPNIPPVAPGPEESADPLALLGYYPVAKLNRMPEAISRFDIRAPAGGDTGIGGKMTIRVWISARGDVDRVRVLGSDLPAEYAQAALSAFERLRFDAGQIDGVKVASWADIVIEYADFTREPVEPSAGIR